MTASHRRTALVSLVLAHVAAGLAVGCSDTVTLPKQGELPGLAPDGGSDAASVDAAPPPPVPPSDAGVLVDSGLGADASSDAGNALDGGASPDAAPADASANTDAGSADAGAGLDAGSPDAGPVSPPAPAGEPSVASCPAVTPTVIAQSPTYMWDIAYDADHAYWTTTEGTVVDHGVLLSVPKAGGVAATRMTETHDAAYRGLDVNGGYVYFTYSFHDAQGAMDNAIAKIAAGASGGSGTVLATRASGLMAPSQVRVLGSRVYFSDQGSGGNWTYGVRSVATSGGLTQFEVDTSMANGATTMPYVGPTGFWFGSFPTAGGLNQAGSVYHASLGTTSPSVVDATGVNTTPTGFVHDGASLFWTEFVPNWPGNAGYPFVDNVGSLMVKTGSAPAYKLAVAQRGGGLTFDPAMNELYFAISFTHGIGNPNMAIVKIPKGGGVVTPVVCNLQFIPEHVHVDATHVYFAETAYNFTNRLYRVAR